MESLNNAKTVVTNLESLINDYRMQSQNVVPTVNVLNPAVAPLKAAYPRKPQTIALHRAIGKSGDLTGYHWGLTRKRAILGWEAGQVAY